MAIDKNSNGFTFLFAIIMVVIVGGLLAVIAMGLKPLQTENKNQEKMKNVMMSIGVMTKKDDMKNAPALFDQYVTEQIVLNSEGQPIEGDAFGIDIQKQYRELKAGAKDVSDAEYPLFKCEKDGETFYVVPLVGTGLWGPIWGYVALEDNLEVIYGANFDHKTETPGLGAEIKEEFFTDQFPNKKLTNADGEYVYITVHKGGGGEGDMNGVDGITGGTITSRGVQDMISNTMGVYVPYFNQIKS